MQGASYPGSERSIDSLLEAFSAEKVKWLVRLGIDINFAGALADDEGNAGLAMRLEAAAYRLELEVTVSLDIRLMCHGEPDHKFAAPPAAGT